MLLESKRNGDALTLRLTGAWRIDNVAEIEAALRDLESPAKGRMTIDCSGIEAIDLSGAWLLQKCIERAKEAGANV